MCEYAGRDGISEERITTLLGLKNHSLGLQVSVWDLSAESSLQNNDLASPFRGFEA